MIKLVLYCIKTKLKYYWLTVGKVSSVLRFSVSAGGSIGSAAAAAATTLGFNPNPCISPAAVLIACLAGKRVLAVWIGWASYWGLLVCTGKVRGLASNVCWTCVFSINLGTIIGCSWYWRINWVFCIILGWTTGKVSIHLVIYINNV